MGLNTQKIKEFLKHKKAMSFGKAWSGWDIRKRVPIFLSLIILFLLFASPAWGTTYYVDATGGLDTNTGLATDQAWKTISKVNNSSFAPGDSILFNKGDTWRHSLTVPSAGTVGVPITLSSYGTGNKPIIMGGDSASAGWEVIRNGQLIEYTDNGASNDGFVGFTTNWGGSVRASVTDGVVSAKLMRVGTAAYIVTADIYLPANTEVSFTYDTKFEGNEGTIFYVKANCTYDATTRYLKTDGTWTNTVTTNIFPSGGADGVWHSETLTFTTDNYTGNYRIGFRTGSTENDAVYLKNMSIILPWGSYVGGTGTKYKIPIAYSPLRFLRYDGSEWIPLLKGSDKDTLANMKWKYEAPYIYFRSDTDAPSAQTLVFSFSAGVVNIVITSKNYVTIDGLAVILGGINSTYSTGTTVTNSDVYSNYYRGIVSGTDVSPVFTYNTVAYNGGNGFAIYTTGGTISNNIVKYNGYWGPAAYDGEGVGVGQDATGVTVSDNDIYGNNVNTAKVGNQLILWNADNCTVARNKIHHGTSNGMAIAGNGNLIHNNLVYANNVVTSEYAVNLRNNEAAPTVGGNKVYNNVFYGGGTTYGNVFIKGDNDYYNGWPNNEFKNNIVWRGSTKSYYTDGYFTDTGSVFDYNIIGAEGTNFIRWKGSNYYSTLAAFAAAQSQDAHSLSSDPLFVDAANGNFHLQAGSSAINAGVDVGLTSDYVGTSVPQGSAPDIGAYEYVQATDTIPPAAPTGITIN